jgi:hypothetical protein
VRTLTAAERRERGRLERARARVERAHDDVTRAAREAHALTRVRHMMTTTGLGVCAIVMGAHHERALVERVRATGDATLGAIVLRPFADEDAPP